MGFDKLSEDVRKKLYSCETPEELLKAASEYGVALSEEELSMINGGADSFRSLKESFIVAGWTNNAPASRRPDKKDADGFFF